MTLAFAVAASSAAAVIAALVTGGVKRTVAVVDVPNQRSSHVRPTPRGGGIAIAAVTVSAMAVVGWSSDVIPFIAAAASMAALGWLDDVRGLGVTPRLAAQFAAAAVVVKTFGSPKDIMIGASTLAVPEALSAAAVLLWIVAVTNDYNFMDGIDGIAGAQAVIAGTTWAIIVWPRDTFSAATALFVAASSAGFLVHNWPPATIFMGDVGSAFLGFTLASLPLLQRGDRAAFATMFVILFPFVFDTAFTLLRRASRGETVWQAHRSHLYQRLVIAGWSHRAVTCVYAAIAATDGVAAVALDRRIPGSTLVAGTTMLGSAAVLLWLTSAAEKARGARA